VLPYTIGDELAGVLGQAPVPPDHPEFTRAERAVDDRIHRFLSTRGTRTVDWFHRELGKLMWDYCGMARNATGLEKALSEIPALREEFERDVLVLGANETLNESLEKVGRVADFFELAELMCRDALHREESCGGHFREEYRTEEGEALRDDDQFAYVAAWEFTPQGEEQRFHKEPLVFEDVKLAQRSYK
jgi:succinate dehydrogenase / fumarate reductase flavoprotein subunit